MENRIKIDQVEPAGYKAILGLEKFLESTPLKRIHKDLIKIRASQINGCAFCIDMHTKEARKAGETEQRIYALNAWRDAPFFSEDERAILALSKRKSDYYRILRCDLQRQSHCICCNRLFWYWGHPIYVFDI